MNESQPTQADLAGSQYRGSFTEMMVIIGSFVGLIVVGLVVFLVVNGKVTKGRQAGIAPVAQLLDGRPFAVLSYAESPMSVPDLLSMAQARGYAFTPNPAALRYEFTRGAPQTAFTGNPRAPYVAQLLDGRDTVELQILYEPMFLPELMVVAHRRGYTVQPGRKVYQFMRHQGRP
ncbi:hypothetical protein M8542_00360 [Amycolatopsis sp. OK19-0408]|uniref:Uncharacterized protein n=1 Tax=Amycolatopsis iheyensis TaxID=2945988 RepID=A0A9X2N2Y0_9PSEU|nr:hypothetical protein [Amycolatopsis iheyensis]MCR6481261.1 hypothetical protein [Amycolatopsis iheyensis]